MAVLTSKARAQIKPSDFVFPETRRYPIHDRNHARAALALSSRFGSPDEKAKVHAAVAKRYPDIQTETAPMAPMMKRGMKNG